jgi:hypothetical protein
VSKRVCACCRTPFKSEAPEDSVCRECISKVQSVIRSKSKGRSGKPPEFSACPECAKVGKRTRLPAVKMRQHRYDVHGFHWGKGGHYVTRRTHTDKTKKKQGEE